MNKSEYMLILKKHKNKIVLILTASLLMWLATAATPYITGKFLDFITQLNFDNASKITMIFLAILIAKSILSYIYYFLSSNLKIVLINDIKYKIISHLEKVKLNLVEKMTPSYINQRIENDSSNCIDFILQDIFNTILSIFKLVILLFIIFSINIKLSIIILLLIPLNFVLYILFQNTLYKNNMHIKEKQNSFFSFQENIINLTKFIKLENLFNYMKDKYNNKFNDLYKANYKYNTVTTTFNVGSQLLQGIPIVILMIFALKLMSQKKISIGEYIALNNYYSLLVTEIAALLQFGQKIQEFKVSNDRINELLTLSIEESGEKQIDTITTIDLKNVSFAYDDSNTLLNNIDYSFKKGYLYLIKGRNGCGKSSLINILTNINQDYSGTITVNGFDIKCFDLNSLRKDHFAIVNQQPVILKDTLETNLILDSTDIDTSKINNLKEMFSLTISDCNHNLSGGEQQKINIVRTLYKKSDILILDEADNCLDIVSMQKLIDVLNKLKKDKIIILISHDSELQQIADYTLEL